MERIMGESPYQSPTDMGVNMAGFAIVDDEACREAARREIVRRYFWTAVEAQAHRRRRKLSGKAEHADEPSGNRCRRRPRAHHRAAEGEETTGGPAGALRLPDGTIVTGKTSNLLGAASSLLINALKALAGCGDIDVISDSVIEPICHLKTAHLGSRNPRLHSDETLLALSVSTATNPLAEMVMEHTGELRGCDAFFSVIISSTDEQLYKKLGINVCCEPRYEQRRYYHK